MTDLPLTVAQRHPLLDEADLGRLTSLLEHPSAPRWNHTCGERLDAAGVDRVRAFGASIESHPPVWSPGEHPQWVQWFLDACRANVPAYRDLPDVALGELPTMSRRDLARAPWAYVPDDLPLDDLIVHATSGTGGRPIAVLQDPLTVARYYPLHEAALRAHGVEPRYTPARMAWMTVALQRDTFVLASVSGYLGKAATAKVNLHDSAWRAPGDREAFLNHCDPVVITGDPIAFAALGDLGVDLHPAAMVSTAMALLPALRDRLAARFGCPVIDLYGVTEAGPVAHARPDGAGYALLQPTLFVEILGDDGRPCPPGVGGEITLTGGFNPFLPLIRYRTGDHAALEWRDPASNRPVLSALEGRAPLVLRAADGTDVNTIDVTKALNRFALSQYSLHQSASGAVILRVRDLDLLVGAQLKNVLVELFGRGTPVAVVPLVADDKTVTYTRDPPP